MPLDLHSLLSAAIEEVYSLELHLELLEIALEQLENSNDKLDLRSSLLINLFLSNAKCHYEELRMHLNQAVEVSGND